MKLRIYQIKNPGNINKERLILVAKEKVDTWDYAIGKTEGDNDTFYPIFSLYFMLPRIHLEKGDMLSIYTKEGSPDKFSPNDKITVNRIYMGYGEPIWTPESKIVITEIYNYISISAKNILLYE